MTQNVQNQTTDRIEWIDYVKGLTIIMVAQMHITLGTQEMTGATHMWLADFVEFAHPFRVPLFFIIAGLFVSRSLKWDLTRFTDILLLPVEPFSTLWFIHALALFFMVTRLFKNVPPIFLFGGAIILYAAPVHTGWTTLDEFASRYIFFLAGWHGSKFFFDVAAFARDNVTRVFAGSLAAFAMVYFFVAAGIAEKPLFGLLAAFAGAIATIALLSVAADRGKLKWLSYVGKRSLYVYLAFFLPGAVTRIALVKTGVIENADAIAAIATSVAVISPLVGAILIARTPLAFLFTRPKSCHLRQKPQLRKTFA